MEEIGSYIFQTNRSERWNARFYNPITRQTEHLGSGGTYEDALELYSVRQQAFYMEHKYLLPKSIFITGGMFRVGFNIKRIYGSSGHKHIHIGAYKTLQQALKAREEVVLSIMQ